ncbi:rhomboid family intramembrane serine protease [Mariniphaga sediminis]|uniref:Rhomboid family intramembrane serine protease n=1 Tax=Mariniphaga sediminis TaxID=1628158 RepID=A0A399D243_9BACT|nr:rhomboid family intramembrane serine protease [Mariniphaga sediminis]RIH64751.1 rhomboid family intramembrane serine protease [Mariniphaga sediminis]
MGIFKYYPSNPRKLDPEMEKRIFLHSLVFPAAFIFVFWIVEIVEVTTSLSFVKLGVYPLHLKGLPGIIFSPFIHSGFNHLMSNSIPFFILLFMLIYFYRRISYQIFFLLYFLSGLSVWLAGREAWHIGASGVVYAMAAFHFVSGIIRNDVRLLTLSVVVVFLYGGLIWGIFPIDPEISWEGHLWGAVSGVVLAIYYRKYTIRRDKFDWEEEEETSSEQSQSTGEEREEGDSGQVQVHFTLKDSANKENPEGQQNVKSGDDQKKQQQHSSLLSEKYPPRSTSHTGNM